MRIAIDAHAIGSALTGNERYIENLAGQLLCLDGENDYFFFFTNEDAKRQWENRGRNLSTLLVSHNPWLRLGVEIPRHLRRIRPSVFHYQYTGPLVRFNPEVVTIHDVSFERHPKFFPLAERLRLKLTVRRAVQTARQIITVSEFSKREIVNLLGAPEAKVKVIYNGVGAEFESVADPEAIRLCLERYSVRQPFVLAVGNISRRKNHLATIRGFALWRNRHPRNGYQLVIAGKPQNAARAVFREARRLGLDENGLNVLGYVPEADLPHLYAGADLLLNTSLYEGFGLPLIEAMRCRLPVIASRSSCFPEIAADAARLVSPEDPGEIADAIDDVLANSSVREELVTRGVGRANFFRWDTAARETLRVYHEAIREGPGR